MVSILDPSIKLDMDAFMIDYSWYYGCLFRPRNFFDGNGKDHCIPDDERSLHSVAEKDVRNEESLREESNISSTSCFGLSDFDSANVCKKYLDVEAECFACMFRILDEDGDGRVSVDEMMRYLERLSLEMPKEEVEIAVRSVSACGDVFLTAMEFNEFYKMIFADQEEKVDSAKVEEQTLCEAFGMFDKNGDGLISAMELGDVLCRLGFVEGSDVNCCKSMIEGVDYNGDGFVDMHEFRHLINRTTSPHPCLQCNR